MSSLEQENTTLKTKIKKLQLENEELKKKLKIEKSNDCKDIKYNNYKIQSNNVISAYYGNVYYSFNDI